MPAESIHEQIAAALKALLAGITAGTDYWYTPSRVERTTFFEETDLNAAYPHVILIRPGDEVIRELSTGDASTGGGLRADMEVWVLIARRHEAASENPYEEAAPTRWTVINRAIRDVLRKVFFGSGVTLSGVAVNVAQESLVVDRARYVAKWALCEIRFVISYDFMAATP